MNVVAENNYHYRILCALRRVIRAVDIYSRKLNSNLGLTTPQLLCLEAVSKEENMTLTRLTQNVHLGVSTVNGIIDRLEAKQYLRRQRSDNDRRVVYLELTDAGRGVLDNAPSLLQDKLSESFGELPGEEQKIITDSLERIVQLMEAENIDASPNLFATDKILS